MILIAAAIVTAAIWWTARQIVGEMRTGRDDAQVMSTLLESLCKWLEGLL